MRAFKTYSVMYVTVISAKWLSDLFLILKLRIQRHVVKKRPVTWIYVTELINQ